MDRGLEIYDISGPLFAYKENTSKRFTRINMYSFIDIRVYTCYNIIKIRKGEKQMPMTPKEMIKLLKQNGFKEVSQNGSHIKMVNEYTKKQTIVPYHGKALKKGLEQAILKQAGLK